MDTTMKFIVTEGDSKTEYFEAKSITDVYRYLLSRCRDIDYFFQYIHSIISAYDDQCKNDWWKQIKNIKEYLTHAKRRCCSFRLSKAVEVDLEEVWNTLSPNLPIMVMAHTRFDIRLGENGVWNKHPPLLPKDVSESIKLSDEAIEFIYNYTYTVGEGQQAFRDPRYCRQLRIQEYVEPIFKCI